jgi:hypothetical protein
MIRLILVLSVFLFSGISKPFEEVLYYLPVTEALVVERPHVAVPKQYYNMIVMVCDFYDIPEYPFSKMLEVESNFNPMAVSGPNANGTYDYGIAQLNSAYLEEFGWRYKFGKIDPFDPEQSIHVAAKHLSVLYEHIGSWEKAFMAYNIGLSRVLSGRTSKNGVEYVDKIFGRRGT